MSRTTTRTPAAAAVRNLQLEFPLAAAAGATRAWRLTRSAGNPRTSWLTTAAHVAACGPVAMLREPLIPSDLRLLATPVPGGEVPVVFSTWWSRLPQVLYVDGGYKVVVGPSYRNATPSQQRVLYRRALRNDTAHQALNVAATIAQRALLHATRRVMVGDRAKLTPVRAVATVVVEMAANAGLKAGKRALARNLRQRPRRTS